MKNYIMFFVSVLVMVFSSYEISYSQKIETGNFYFLTGTVGDREVILYLNIIGTNIFGYYNNVEGSFEMKGFVDSDGKINIWNSHLNGNLSDSGVFTGNIGTNKINLSLADTSINSAKISAERVRLSGQLGRGDNFKYKNIKYDFNNSKLNYIVNNSNNREDLKICYLDDKIVILYSEADGFSASLNDNGFAPMGYGYDFSRYMKKDGNTNYRDKNSGYPYYFVYSLDTYEEIYISDFIDFSAYNSLISKMTAMAASDSDEEFSKFFSYSKPYTFSVQPNGNIIIGFYSDISLANSEFYETEDLENLSELINEGWKFYFSFKSEVKRDNDGIEMLKLILKKGSPLEYLIN